MKTSIDRDSLEHRTLLNLKGSQTEEALNYLQFLIIEGLLHGFFEYTISCQTDRGGKRQLTYKAGKSHRYTIPDHDLPKRGIKHDPKIGTYP